MRSTISQLAPANADYPRSETQLPMQLEITESTQSRGITAHLAGYQTGCSNFIKYLAP